MCSTHTDASNDMFVVCTPYLFRKKIFNLSILQFYSKFHGIWVKNFKNFFYIFLIFCVICRMHWPRNYLDPNIMKQVISYDPENEIMAEFLSF